MSDQIEAAGAFVTAGLAARSLEQAAAGHGDHPAACANCDAPLIGPYCAQCGQPAHLHRTIGGVFHDFLHGITHFDGKTWQTLPMLLFRPGRLTRSYIDGHRARYVGPVSLFLLVVFLMFFVLSFVHLPDVPVSDASPAEQQAAAAETLAGIDAQIAKARAKGDSGEIARLQLLRSGVETLRTRARDGHAAPGEIVDGIGAALADASARGAIKVNTGVPWIDARGMEAVKNPSLMLYKLQSKAYKLSFLLVPLSLPWLWLAFFWRRDIGLYDHAIFTLYSISFMSLLFIVASLGLTAGITLSLFWEALLFAPAVHMFAQLRGAYNLGWFGAGWRTLYLTVAGVMSLSIYLVILIVIGIVD